MRSAISRTCCSCSPSTMTRIRGSVPDLRTAPGHGRPVPAPLPPLPAERHWRSADPAFGEAHIDQYLRELAHARTQFGQRHLGTAHGRQHLQGGDDTIPRGGLIQADDVTGVFAPMRQPFSFIISNARSGHLPWHGQRDAQGLKRQLQPHVGHQGAHHTAPEAAMAQGIPGDDVGISSPSMM